MTIKYYLRGKGNSVPVYIRVSISREKLYRKKTRFIANSEKWDKDKSLQLKLRKLQNEIEESYNDTLIHDDNWIDRILYFEFKEETVQNQIKHILKNSHLRKNHKGGVGLSEGRKSILKTFLRLLDRYRPNLPLTSCNKKLADDFISWLSGQGYSINYIGKNIELLKTACRDAEKDGKKINPEIKQVSKLTERKKELVIVTPEEQKTIKELELPPYLDNARKWLLLGCLVGQRGGDLLALEKPKDINGKMMFEVQQQKTGKKIFIPVVPDAEWIVEQFPYYISLQKLNDYLKEVCEKANMNQDVWGYKRGKKGKPSKTGYFKKWQLIGTHDLRRSFATNYYGKIPTPILMSITGHSSESTFLKYIGKSSMDNALEFLSYF